MPEKDILAPLSSERARAAYLEQQMQNMSGIRPPLNIPSMEEEFRASTDLTRRIHTFCKEQKERRKQEWESHKNALDMMKESKGKHQPHNRDEREVVYSQIASMHGKSKECSKKFYKPSIHYFS